MKAFIAFLLFAAVSARHQFSSRITGGTDAKANSVPSFVALEIEFERGIRSCGGFLGIPEDRVITSASCVFDASEGKASSVKLAFGQSNDFSKNKLEVNDIYQVSTFDASKNTSADDLAVIMLSGRVATSKSIAGAIPNTDDKPDVFVGENLIVCGFGITDNIKTKTKKLLCTHLRVVAAAECAKALPAAAPATTDASAGRRKREDTTIAPPAAPKGMICTKNIDDKNACSGDFGAPVFSNKTGSLVPVGVVSFYPDTRPNARCQDGHMVVVTQLGAYQDFLKDPTKPATTAAPPTTVAR